MFITASIPCSFNTPYILCVKIKKDSWICSNVTFLFIRECLSHYREPDDSDMFVIVFKIIYSPLTDSEAAYCKWWSNKGRQVGKKPKIILISLQGMVSIVWRKISLSWMIFPGLYVKLQKKCMHTNPTILYSLFMDQDG